MAHYSKGLQDLGRGAYAYLQPDGGWGWSNAGLIVDGEEALLVDTLFDEHLTKEMLDVMKDATGRGPKDMTTLVNTHANGDHCYGNHLVEGAEIIASDASAKEMDEVPPSVMAAMMGAAGDMGDLGDYLVKCFGAFDFEKITATKPTRTFSGDLSLKVGDKEVALIEVGPCHTHGDVLVHVPEDRVVYTGDVLFIDGTPIMWQGPVSNWIKACDRIQAMDVDYIVPGHGPLTDKAGVQKVADYLSYIDGQARKRFDAGMDWKEAARDIALGDYSSWIDSERIAVNVNTLYKEYQGSESGADIFELFGMMAELAKR
ncbi:MAG: MBL fold metallo-hydrolase [Alphaproteobacteria bacterium]|nr:MAG: MBL fold metallo-hydrolase [Alphaproteobacteria bacterium]